MQDPKEPNIAAMLDLTLSHRNKSSLAPFSLFPFWAADGASDALAHRRISSMNPYALR